MKVKSDDVVARLEYDWMCSCISQNVRQSAGYSAARACGHYAASKGETPLDLVWFSQLVQREGAPDHAAEKTSAKKSKGDSKKPHAGVATVQAPHTDVAAKTSAKKRKPESNDSEPQQEKDEKKPKGKKGKKFVDVRERGRSGFDHRRSFAGQAVAGAD
jgi:hypothetical protein